MRQRSKGKLSYVEKKARKLVGKAIHQYGLIQGGDRIAVALSGGVDSTALVWLLHQRKRRAPLDYELLAVHVGLGFPGEDLGPVQAWLRELGIPWHHLETDYGLRAHGPENRENPCFLCARLRRASLFKAARSLGANKIAFGHNLDDLIETFFINIIYGSQVATMMPRQPFFGGEITVIRPLALLDADTIRRFHRHCGLPLGKNNCPSKDKGARSQIRQFLQQLYRQNKKIRGNISHAMHNINLEYLPGFALTAAGGNRGDAGPGEPGSQPQSAPRTAAPIASKRDGEAITPNERA